MCNICFQYTCPDGCPNNFSLKKGERKGRQRRYAVGFIAGAVMFPSETGAFDTETTHGKIMNKNTNEIRNEI